MQEYLAIASVPVQSWGELFTSEEALCIGTIFRDLNKPFFAASENVPTDSRNGGSATSPEQKEREGMLLQIQETGFVLDDLRLYLDTHPDDRQGLALLKDKLRERKELLKTYALRFYPLTPDCSADIYEKEPAPEYWCWQKGPMPWEGACV